MAATITRNTAYAEPRGQVLRRSRALQPGEKVVTVVPAKSRRPAHLDSMIPHRLRSLRRSNDGHRPLT